MNQNRIIDSSRCPQCRAPEHLDHYIETFPSVEVWLCDNGHKREVQTPMPAEYTYGAIVYASSADLMFQGLSVYGRIKRGEVKGEYQALVITVYGDKQKLLERELERNGHVVTWNHLPDEMAIPRGW